MRNFLFLQWKSTPPPCSRDPPPKRKILYKTLNSIIICSYLGFFSLEIFAFIFWLFWADFVEVACISMHFQIFIKMLISNLKIKEWIWQSYLSLVVSCLIFWKCNHRILSEWNFIEIKLSIFVIIIHFLTLVSFWIFQTFIIRIDLPRTLGVEWETLFVS